MDYSENVSCTPKYEPQDAHFSGNQTTLHCTVLNAPDKPDEQCIYVYHLSDDKRLMILLLQMLLLETY